MPVDAVSLSAWLQLLHAEQRLSREIQALQDYQSRSIAGGADALVSRIHEEVQMNKYLASEKLPSVWY